MQKALIILLAVPVAALPGLKGAPIKMIYDDHYHGQMPECVKASKESGYVHRTPSEELYKGKSIKQAYFINRKGDTKRFAHMQTECKVNLKGVPCKKFPAVESNHIGMEKAQLSKYSTGDTTDWLSKATTKRQNIFKAIFLSNAQVIHQIAESDPEGIKNDDLYMIMEDDSVILPGFQQKLTKLLSNTPADWQVLRLGYWGRVRCEDRVSQYAVSIQYPSVDKKAIGEDHFYSGNQGYLVRGSAIPEIIAIMKEHNMGAIENAFMYPSTMGRQIISYAVAPEMKLLGMTHEGIEGASQKADKKSSLLARKQEETKQEETTESIADQMRHVFSQKSVSIADASAFIEARSHPKTNVSECVSDVRTELPKFSKKPSKYAGTKKFLYINVNNNGRRSENMASLINTNQLELPALRVQGVTKADIQKGTVDIAEYSSGQMAKYMEEYSAHTRLVTTAIWMSHAKALKQIADEDDGTDPDAVYIVLEDDAWFEPQWEAKLQTLLEHTPSDWDMLKLGYWGNRHCIDKVNKYIYQANGPTFQEGTLFYQGNTGYAVKASSAKRILQSLQENEIADIDGAFLTNKGKSKEEGCSGTCLKVYAASMKKVFIVDRNLGTFRTELKSGGKKQRKMTYAGFEEDV